MRIYLKYHTGPGSRTDVGLSGGLGLLLMPGPWPVGEMMGPTIFKWARGPLVAAEGGEKEVG